MAEHIRLRTTKFYVSKACDKNYKSYSTGTQYTRQSLNGKRHTWLHRQTVNVCEAMSVVFHSNFAAYIVCRRYKPCEFPGFVWTDRWGNKSYYVITSPANIRSSAPAVNIYSISVFAVSYKMRVYCDAVQRTMTKLPPPVLAKHTTLALSIFSSAPVEHIHEIRFWLSIL